MNSEDIEEQIEDILYESYDLPNSDTKIAMLEQAISLSDEINHVYYGYATRTELIEAATFGGYREKALVAFSWCLAQWDKDPEIGDEYDLLWKFKWVLDHLSSFPQVSLSQIREMIEDFEQRLTKLDFSPRPAHYLHWALMIRMGYLEEAEEYIEKWKNSARDELADCEACECDKYTEYLYSTRQFEQQIEQVAPILDGKLTCAEIPHFTYAGILKPLIHLNRMEEAAKFHKLGYKMIKSDKDFVSIIPDHLFYLIAIHEYDSALRILEIHFPWVAETTDKQAQMDYFLAASLLFEHLQDKSSLKLRMPKKWDCYLPDGVYSPKDLLMYFQEQTEELESQFNERNGNRYSTELNNRIREMIQFAHERGNS